MEVYKTSSNKYNLYYHGQKLNRRQMTKAELHQMLIMNGYTGQGILDKIKHVARVARNVFTNDVSFQTEDALKRYSSYNITEATIYRIPVDVKAIVDLISGGKFTQNVKKHFDDVYHLLIILKMVDPATGKEAYLKTEKRPNIEFVTLDSYERNYKDSEKYVWKLQAPANFGKVIDDLMKRLGSKFVKYDPVDNNCQVWILNLCYAMSVVGITRLPKTLHEFIYQDPAKLFEGLERTPTIARAVTSLGHLVGRIRGLSDDY